jgi:uncharacterized membrane protein
LTPRTLILWLHVSCGLIWVGANMIFVLASLALSRQDSELRELVGRAAPSINRIGLVCAVLIPVTGLGNLGFAARAHRFALAREFTAIVFVKMLLLALMGWALSRAIGIVGNIQAFAEGTIADRDAAIRRLRNCYGAIAGGGAIALLLGLWLAGL